MTAEIVSDFLRKNKLRLCAAESFTGGEVASAFVCLPGASNVFASSLVCYTQEAKKALLGVSEQTLFTYGAVSEQTVSEMLDGLARLNLGEVFVATSGNAGPTSEKPDEVGLVYIGAMTGDKKVIKKLMLSGDRNEIINKGVTQGLQLIYDVLTDADKNEK